MASEYYECKAELSTTDTLDGVVKEEPTEIKPCSKYRNEPNARAIQFDAIHIMKQEIVKEDLIETKPFNECGVFNECLGKNGKKQFYGPYSSEFQVKQRNNVEDLKESKLSPTNFWENTDFNGFSGELAKSKVNNFDNGIIPKNEDEAHSKFTKDWPANNTELKTETFKSEYDIDIIYEDVKPQICEEVSSGNSVNESYLNPVTNILIGTKIGANLSCEFSRDSETWPQQNIEEDGTALEINSDTREEPLENCQIIQKFKETPRSGEKPFQCKSCPKSFTRKHNLLGHERGHAGEKPFQCKVCWQSFANRSTLLQHEKIHTGDKSFHCKICPKSFKEKKGLARHERTHTGERPYQCKICPKSFYLKHYLTVHAKIHTGEKPFECKVCPKSFACRSTLLQHQDIHTGEKPFQCIICPECFAHRSTLFYHKKIHTGEKLFQCKICLKSFNLKQNLTVHQRIHTGEKPFQCKICPMSFAVNSSLLRHEKIHKGEKSFQCKVCSKSFKLKQYLTVHERIHTPIKNISM